MSAIDKVICPTHYTQGDIECIDAMRSMLTEEEFRGYVKAAVLKYVWREGLKEGDQDLAKAYFYLGELLGKHPRGERK